MSKNTVLLAGIILFFFSVLAFSYLYGPTRRSLASPSKILTVETTEQILQAWETSRVKGRIAICFTRYLNALETKESKSLKVIEGSMHKGILRRVYHITPDSAWPEIQGVLAKRDDMRPTSEGFIGIFDDGRAYIMPLSKFSRMTEKVLLIIEPKVWTGAELSQIAEKLKSDRISSDLVVIIRGSEQDAELFRHAMNHQFEEVAK